MQKFSFSILYIVISFMAIGQVTVDISSVKQTTYCNPLNLNYRFCLDTPSRREAADPVIVLFQDDYYLFASKSGGYWHSKNLITWDLINSNILPLEDYAPAAVVMNDTLYFMASGQNPVSIYKTHDPKSGKWVIANAAFPLSVTDPDLFADDDGRLYLYYGCSNSEPIYGVELDPRSLYPLCKPVECLNSRMENNGWEQRGDYNNLGDRPWVEGSWMTKHNGKYYLQYAVPGTEYKSYSDGVYISDTPLGNFILAEHNPCSYKPEGFIAGAGHSSTFKDKYGNFWHISTMSISQKHPFERRLGLFPMFFDNDGYLFAFTTFGDSPFIIPDKKITSPDELSTQWMLLSYKKPVEGSSEIGDHPERYAVDEEIRTYWSAKTGNEGEWISIDLLNECTINAVQINYAEHNTQTLGRNSKLFFQYLIEYSNDKQSWSILENRTQVGYDSPHDYIELAIPVKARYIKFTNYYVPDGTFALSGLRIFGNREGEPPSMVKNFVVARSENDRRQVKLTWDRLPDAVGYNIRYGVQADKLYHTYQVLGSDTITIRSLNRFQKYYFTIDVFNETGVKQGTEVIAVE